MANGSKYHFEISNAYIAVEGYRYRLIKTEVPNPADVPRAVCTFQLTPLM
jgi:hypothetical protein